MSIKKVVVALLGITGFIILVASSIASITAYKNGLEISHYLPEGFPKVLAIIPFGVWLVAVSILMYDGFFALFTHFDKKKKVQ